MARSNRTTERRPSRARALIATITAALLAGTFVAVPAAPAFAQAGMTIAKTASDTDLAPDEDVTFTITVQCADEPCEDVVISDPIPEEFAGFDVVSYTIDPTPAEVPSTFDPAGCAAGGTVVAGCEPTLSFDGPVPTGSATLSITLHVPADLPPDWEFNGDTVTNTASLSWSNTPEGVTPPITDSDDVVVTVPVETGVTGDKVWEPASQQFSPGAASTITLSLDNDSNVPAESLVIQEPATAVDGATELDASNPFRLVDFTGFGAVTLPPNATTVTVQAYVYDDDSGTWSWTTDGVPAATPTLPASVDDPAEVGGIRLTFEDDIQPTEGVDVPVTVAQRETDRNDDTSLAPGTTMTNEIAGTATFADEDAVSDTWTAPFTITPLTVDVTPGKTFAPAIVPGGSPSVATLTAQNASNGPVQTLTIVDTGFFDEDLAFTGFPGGIACPDTTSTASISWEVDGASLPATTFPCGTAPTPPAVGTVTGFTVTFDGQYAAGTTATVPAEVTPSTDLVTTGDPTEVVTNTMTAEATNAAGTASEDAPADLTIVFPEVSVDTAKSISPSAPVEPGANVLATITATTGSGDADVDPTTIVVEDSWGAGDSGTGDPNAFWNAFDLYSIAPTQVPANTTLTIEYQVDGDPTWQELVVVPPQPGSFTYAMSNAELVAALAPTPIEDVVGIRFTFENPDGFPQGQSVEPNVGFTARAELRDGTGETDVADDGTATPYTNWAHANTSADVDGLDDPIESGDSQASDDAQIQVETGEGDGPSIEKRWVQPTDHTADLEAIVSQSGDQATTRIEWYVPTNEFETVVISDPASPVAGGDPPDPRATTFQAFDLVSIDPISFTQDDRLRWDTVSQVELFLVDTWAVVAPPGGSWMDATGFVGHVLTADESRDATGVRLTIVPNVAARTGATDPTAPAPDVGVAPSPDGTPRPIDLTWQLRNTVRVVQDAPPNEHDPWVTAEHGYNGVDPNVVWNNSRIDGESVALGDQSSIGRDAIVLIDELPGVTIDKTVAPESITIPAPEDVAPADYPVVVYTVDGENASPARASYIRVTDPAPCDPGTLDECVMSADDWDGDPFAGRAYDPATNPYEEFDLTGIAFSFDDASEVDTTASTVTLWHRAADGTLSTSTVSVADAATLDEAALSDVVGVSVVYQSTSPETTGGSITQGNTLSMQLSSRLRVANRSDDTEIVPQNVRNLAQSQSYDPVLAPDPDDPSSEPYANDDAIVELLGGELDIVAGKTITPETVLEADADDTEFAVALTADSGDSTVPTQLVTITDDDPDFWNAVELSAIPDIAATLPAGADQVRVDVLVAGIWVTGTYGPTATLPGVPPATVSGIRFLFSRADGGVFSTTAPSDAWSASASFDVELLLEQRDGTPLPFPGTLDNIVDETSERTDGLFPSAEDDANDTISLDPGTYQIDVVKTQPGTSHTVAVGSTGTWTLEFTNTGTGILTIDELVDTLPDELEWDGVEPTYATSADGTLGTDVTLTPSADGSELTFTWPADANRMQPGEVFTITLGLTLVPGLAEGEQAVNTMVVDTAETLAACTNDSGNGEGTVPDLADDQCGTTNYVEQNPGGALFATKTVNGDVENTVIDGESNPSDPSVACVSDAGYSRLPCASHTAVGAEDEWHFEVVNAGTVPYTQLVLVDPLPMAGDRMLATGSARNSEFRPVLQLDTVRVLPLLGVTTTVEVTTSADACVGAAAGSVWFSDPTCDTTATWEAADAFAGDPAELTAIRVTVVFATPLPSGDSIELRYRTVNEPASGDLPEGAPIDVPDTAPGIAWNQAGATASLTAGAPLSTAPAQAGVQLFAGDLGVTKLVVGDTSAAPDEFDFEVVCTVAGVDLVLPDDGALTLTRPGLLRADILGIPLGSECVVSEVGDVGTYGEAERFGDAETHVIVTPSDGSGSAPVVQTARVQNRYPFPAPPGPPDPPDPNDLSGTGLSGVSDVLGVALATLALGALLLAVGTRRRRGESGVGGEA